MKLFLKILILNLELYRCSASDFINLRVAVQAIWSVRILVQCYLTEESISPSKEDENAHRP